LLRCCALAEQSFKLCFILFGFNLFPLPLAVENSPIISKQRAPSSWRQQHWQKDKRTVLTNSHENKSLYIILQKPGICYPFAKKKKKFLYFSIGCWYLADWAPAPQLLSWIQVGDALFSILYVQCIRLNSYHYGYVIAFLLSPLFQNLLPYSEGLIKSHRNMFLRQEKSHFCQYICPKGQQSLFQKNIILACLLALFIFFLLYIKKNPCILNKLGKYIQNEIDLQSKSDVYFITG